MATILYVSTFGSDDPTRASMPFVAATGALEAGHQPQVALMGEAAYLMKSDIAELVSGVGLAPLKEILPKLMAQSVPIYVWGLCGKARGVTDADLQGKNAQFITPKGLAELTVAADRVVSF